MDGILYPVSLAVLALFAFIFNQSNNSKLALFMVLIGVYMVYVHETGTTATDWKNDIVKSIDSEVGTFNKNHGIKK